jgi:hypothetical protein
VKKTLTTAAAVGGLGVAMLLTYGVGAAQATDAGPFSAIGTSSSITTTSGTNLDVVAVQVAQPCNPAATRHVLKVLSVVPKNAADKAEADKWAGDNLYAPTAANLPGPLSVSASNFWQGLADTFGQKLVAGKYQLELRCQNNLGTTIFEQWHGSVTFSSPTAWVADPLTAPSITPTPTTTSPSPTVSVTPRPSPSVTPSRSPTPSVTPTSTPTSSPTTTVSSSPSPSTSTSPTDEGGLSVTLDGDIVEDGATLRPGDELEVVADGFDPDEPVTVTLASPPTKLATLTADQNGSVSYSFVVPEDIESGGHTLTLLGSDSSTEHVFSFTVENTTNTSAGGVLAQTGIEVGAMVGLGVLLLVAGAVFLMASRARRPRTH